MFQIITLYNSYNLVLVTGKEESTLPDEFLSLVLVLLGFLYVGRNWLIVNLIIMLTQWWLLKTEMHTRHLKPSYLSSWSVYVSKVNCCQNSQLNSLKSNNWFGYSGKKKKTYKNSLVYWL